MRVDREVVLTSPAWILADLDVIRAGDRGVEEEGLVATIGELGADGNQIAEGVKELDFERRRVRELAALIRRGRRLQVQRLPGLDIDRVPVVNQRVLSRWRGEVAQDPIGAGDALCRGDRVVRLYGERCAASPPGCTAGPGHR